MRDWTKATNMGLHYELELCRAYGKNVLSPPEKTNSAGYDAVNARFDAVKKEMQRRKEGVLVGRIGDLEDWEEIPKWSPTVYCVRFPSIQDTDLVAFWDRKLAESAAEKFNEEATSDFLFHVGPATVVEREGY